MDNKVQNAIKWTLISEIIIKLISPVTSMILARIFTPKEFGVVATVTMIISFTDIFTDAGFQKYIVQHKFADEKDEDISICVAFWTNLMISIALWVLIRVFSNQIALIAGNRGMGKVIYIGALVLPVTSFGSIQTAVFRKKLNFKSISITRMVIKLIPLLVSVPLAKMGFSFWALIIGNIVGEIVNASILTYLSPWKPKLQYSFMKLLEMIHFSVWTFLETITSWLVTNLGIFIIGKSFDEYYTGIYKTSTTMVVQVVSIISGATMGVLFSALSDVQDDKEKFDNIFYGFIRGVGVFAVPLGFGMLLYGNVVRIILLGSQWQDADLIVSLWGFVMAESVIFNDMSGAVVLSKGKPQFIMLANAIQAVLVIPTFYFCGKLGFNVLVVVSSLVRFQLPITQTIFCCKVSEISFANIWNNLKYYFISSFLMVIIGVILKHYFSILILEFISIVICILFYFSTLLLFKDSRLYLIGCLNKIKNSVLYRRT